MRIQKKAAPKSRPSKEVRKEFINKNMVSDYGDACQINRTPRH